MIFSLGDANYPILYHIGGVGLDFCVAYLLLRAAGMKFPWNSK